MMRVFQHAQQRHLRLSPELQQLIRRQAAAGGADVPVLARGAGDLPGDPVAERGGGPGAADDARGGFPGAVHPGVRGADLPGAARVFPPLHGG